MDPERQLAVQVRLKCRFHFLNGFKADRREHYRSCDNRAQSCCELPGQPFIRL